MIVYYNVFDIRAYVGLRGAQFGVDFCLVSVIKWNNKSVYWLRASNLKMSSNGAN